MHLQHTPFIQKQFSGTDLQGNLSIYTVVKATYDFNHHGELTIADEQEAIITHDQFYDHPKSSSIQYPEESMPFKKGGELLLIGSLTPRTHENKQQTITLKLKKNNVDWQKSLTLFGKRYWYNTLLGAKISEPEILVESIDLRYEFSFGGNDYPANPIGKGFTEKWLNVSDIELPQIEYTQALIRSPRSRPYIAGFNAIAKHWQPRLDANNALNPAAHNLAPLDQQFSTPFQGDEVLHIAGWTTQQLSQKPITLSIPKLVNYNNQRLGWDTVTINMNKQKLYLLTRYHGESTHLESRF